MDKSLKLSWEDTKKTISFYLKNTKFINNRDLVDVSCSQVLWKYILKNPEQIKILKKLAKSKNLREQRISIVSNWILIKNGIDGLVLELSKKFLDHKHHLIHKAIWRMLREVWKNDISRLKSFLSENAKNMPSVSFSYSIERLSDSDKEFYRGLRK